MQPLQESVMSKKELAPKTGSHNSTNSGPTTPKYQHPKILLIDSAPEISEALKKEGYNITTGTFGTPYKVTKDSTYQPVVAKASLPNFTEQEIIVIDLVPSEVDSAPPGEKMVPASDLDWWAKCSAGEIDPRPRSMELVKHQFDRILGNGGVFVVFSDSRNRQELVCARQRNIHSGLSIDCPISSDNWSFLSVLSNLMIKDDHGEEIQPIKHDLPLVKLLTDHLDRAQFYCTLNAQYPIKSRWIELAKNKYGEAVAGVIAPSNNTEKGWVFVLPRIQTAARFLSEFLKNILPNLSPALFPHAEGSLWIHRAEYELPSVLEKRKQISTIQHDAAKKVAELETAIKEDHRANAFLYALIRETGDPLVEAVETALALIGFKAIVDVDKEMTKAGKENSLREDLRIHDLSPVLVVDIKGITGRPADAEALQAQKHAFIYIQEQNRADVRGLTIINHQRLWPPLERDNDMPFRKEILDNAAQVKLGLMTGWDLFRLVRGFINNQWKTEHVIPLFYQTGRILPIPQHYEYIGTVNQVWKQAFSINIEVGELRVGEQIMVEFPVDFHEQRVLSLQVNNKSVDVAAAKCEVGVQRGEDLPKVKSGMLVYRIK
ncbi:MAG: hypothetical protein JNK05_05370 [Myxococcales bacterium]|nr:hypothetical protein [Myxococcales bacterium]